MAVRPCFVCFFFPFFLIIRPSGPRIDHERRTSPASMRGTKSKKSKSARKRELAAARAIKRAERSAGPPLGGTCEDCGQEKKNLDMHKNSVHVNRVISDTRPGGQLTANRSTDKLFHCQWCTARPRLRCARAMKVSASTRSLHPGVNLPSRCTSKTAKRTVRGSRPGT